MNCSVTYESELIDRNVFVIDISYGSQYCGYNGKIYYSVDVDVFEYEWGFTEDFDTKEEAKKRYDELVEEYKNGKPVVWFERGWDEDGLCEELQ